MVIGFSNIVLININSMIEKISNVLKYANTTVRLGVPIYINVFKFLTPFYSAQHEKSCISSNARNSIENLHIHIYTIFLFGVPL